MFQRVRALLAKAESTTFPAEAEALTGKAQELMARHAIDAALLDDTDDGAATGLRIGVDDPYAQPKSLLLAVVAEANRCRAVWSRHLGFSTVFGFPTDLDAVEVLYTSLLVQAGMRLSAAGSQRDHSGRSRTRSFRSSFFTSYAIRIGERLHKAADAGLDAATAEHGDRLLPVLARRDAAVEAARDTAFPALKENVISASNAAGWTAGRAAADLADLGTRSPLNDAASA